MIRTRDQSEPAPSLPNRLQLPCGHGICGCYRKETSRKKHGRIAMKTTSENGRHTTNGRLGKKKEAEKDLAATYNQFKEFEGKRYTGMKIGRRHKWYYDKGEWNEKKVTPDKWEFTFAVTKRRAGKAPEGSGVPVGT